MSACPSCGAEHPAGAACDAGAGAVGVMHRCGRCGGEYQGGDACPACGAPQRGLPCDAHGDRLACGRCVLCGRAVCGDCGGTRGRVVRCAEHRAVTVIEGWAQVYSTTGEWEAQLVRENLAAEGVEAQIFSQRDSTFTVDLGELSIVRVLVPVWEYQQARALIREHMDAGGEVSFACPACGEAQEPGAESCAACGTRLS